MCEGRAIHIILTVLLSKAAIESSQVPRGIFTVTKRLFAQQILTDSMPLSFKELLFRYDISSELCKLLTGPALCFGGKDIRPENRPCSDSKVQRAQVAGHGAPMHAPLLLDGAVSLSQHSKEEKGAPQEAVEKVTRGPYAAAVFSSKPVHDGDKKATCLKNRVNTT